MEMEGTYPLPEAQADRFLFKLNVPFPDKKTLVEISKRTAGFAKAELREIISAEQIEKFQKVVSEIAVADGITEAAADLIISTHADSSEDEDVQRFVHYGAGPRALQSFIRAAKVYAILRGGFAVAREDLVKVARPALRHRMILNFQGESQSLDLDAVIDRLVAKAIDG